MSALGDLTSPLTRIGRAVAARLPRDAEGAPFEAPEAIAARDLGRLYDLVDLGLRGGLGLSTAQVYVVLDAANGIGMMDLAFPERGLAATWAGLAASVVDTLRLAAEGHYRHHHQISDEDAAWLPRRLDELSWVQRLALIDAAERFWAQPEAIWVDEDLVRLGLLPGEAA